MVAIKYLPNLGFDPIAANDRIRSRYKGVGQYTLSHPKPPIRLTLGSIFKPQRPPSVFPPLKALQPLSKPGILVRQQFHQLVQVLRPMHARLPQTVRDRESQRICLVMVAIMIVEPDVLLGGPEVSSSDSLERFVDPRVAMFHCLDSILGKRHSGCWKHFFQHRDRVVPISSD